MIVHNLKKKRVQLDNENFDLVGMLKRAAKYAATNADGHKRALEEQGGGYLLKRCRSNAIDPDKERDFVAWKIVKPEPEKRSDRSDLDRRSKADQFKDPL